MTWIRDTGRAQLPGVWWNTVSKDRYLPPGASRELARHGCSVPTYGGASRPDRASEAPRHGAKRMDTRPPVMVALALGLSALLYWSIAGRGSPVVPLPRAQAPAMTPREVSAAPSVHRRPVGILAAQLRHPGDPRSVTGR